MVPVARRNLFAEKLRLAMSVSGVAFAVLLVLIVLSLYRGWSNVGRTITRLPGDVWVTQTGTIDPFHSSSFLPQEGLGEVQAQDGVEFALPVYSRQMTLQWQGETIELFLMALEVPEGVTLPPEASRYVPPKGTINIDRAFARKYGIGPGDVLDALGQPLTVGEVHAGGQVVITQFAFIAAEDARAIFAQPGLVNFFLVSTAPGADLEALGRGVAAAVPGSEIHTSEEFAAGFAADVDEGFLPVVSVLVAIGVVVGGAVIALTTYTATIEKARDFGVLKALGASAMYLYRIVIQQSLIVGVTGSIVGIAASAIAASLIKRWIPEFITDLRWTDVSAVLVAALIMAFVASYLPVRRINSIDPAMVFRA
jgi:putative ABC transport system permease protein